MSSFFPRFRAFRAFIFAGVETIFTRFIITNNVETIFLLLLLLSIVRATVLTPARARTNL